MNNLQPLAPSRRLDIGDSRGSRLPEADAPAGPGGGHCDSPGSAFGDPPARAAGCPETRSSGAQPERLRPHHVRLSLAVAIAVSLRIAIAEPTGTPAPSPPGGLATAPTGP